MLPLNVVLMLHFAAFLGYLATLVAEFPKVARKVNPWALPLGIAILVTGILLVVLKYPVVNYYKVGLKLGIFGIISVLNAVYKKRGLSNRVYGIMIGLTVLASLIAMVRV